MTGTSIILLGVVAFSNIGFLAYLLLDRNRKMRPPADKPPENETAASDEAATEGTPDPRPLVGKSKYNIDDDLESRIDRMVDNAFDRNILRIRQAMLGDVHMRDVEFGDESQASTTPPKSETMASAETAEQPAVKNARMTPEQEASAFDDVRIEDVDSDTVSAPSASGATMEDIEESISTAVNPDSTAEQKAKAAEVLEPLMDTNLLANLMSYEEIYKGIQSCMTELLRADISDKQARKPVKPVKGNKSVPDASAKAQPFVFKIAANIDDFDPADLLK